MNTPQTAILPEHSLACLVLEADSAQDDLTALKAACHHSLAILQQHQARHADARLGMCIGFGHDLWQRLQHPDEGGEIKPFRTLGAGLAPASQHDVAIHIQSDSHAVNLQLAVALLAAFGDSLRVADETHGFRLYQERGHDGFVDGTENPAGEARLPVGVIEAGRPDAGGSYLLLQRYRHNLAQWGALDETRQEAIIGRTKADDEELPAAERLPDSHLGRVDLKENGKGLKILRQSLPYGQASGEKGLMFIAYCASLYPIDQQLLSMFGERDGRTDLLLSNISTAISGGYYFVPACERLAAL